MAQTSVCGTVLALLLMPLLASAQSIPKINSISPEWIQRGTTVEVVLTGENLGAATGFVFSGDAGLSATNVPAPVPPKPVITIESTLGGISRAEAGPARDDKRIVARVTATADSSLTPRELRVLTPGGISNPQQINVGHLPELREPEPNSTLDQAPMIEFPVAISGVIAAAAQIDHFKFKASKGQNLVFDVDAARRGAALDSSLAILDAKGKELARNEDANGLDSLLLFKVPEEGEYVLQLRDFRYQGGANYKYRLYAGALPYVESIFPFGGQRGQQVEIALQGRNLEGTSKMTLNIAPNAPRGRQDIRAHTPRGYSNLIPFDVQDFPNSLETEPNNETNQANSLNIPVVINGRIGEPKDLDRFKFKSDKDQKLICEVIAYRFGSAVDALLVLSDASGNVVQQNDDSAAADARIEFDAKKDAEYVLAIRDLTERGGDNFAYRLAVRPPSPAESGFTARFSPDTPRLHRGGHTRVRCELTRIAGFDGPVRFAFEDLPSGVSSEPLVLTTGPASGLVLISASKDAPLGAFPVRMTATGTVGGKTVTRAVEPLSGDKPARQGFVTVLEPAPFAIELITLSSIMEQTQAERIEFLARRHEGFSGDVKFTAEGFSAGKDPITKSFDVRETTLKSGESMGNVKLTAKVDAEVGTRTVVIRGDATVDGKPVTQYSRPVPVTVREIPFTVASTLTRLNVTALPTNATSAAREAATTVKLTRRGGFTNEVQLSVEGVPTGIDWTLDKIPAGGTEGTLKLVANDKAPPGTNTLTIIGAGLHNDRNFKHRARAVTLVINAPEPGDMPAPPAAAATAATAGGAK
ncbi:MAG: hypothetical protein L0Y58_05580 [Verrucomicrobia subdivision 3 bacterium]|nr:hypothetical protein [Limisphaerales bacterium]